MIDGNFEAIWRFEMSQNIDAFGGQVDVWIHPPRTSFLIFSPKADEHNGA